MSVIKLDANGRPEPEDDGLAPEGEGFAIELDQQGPKPRGLGQKEIHPDVKTPRTETGTAVRKVLPAVPKRTVHFEKGKLGRETLLKKPGLANLVLAGNHTSRAEIDQEAQKRIDALDQRIKELTFEWVRNARALIINGNKMVAKTSQPEKTQAELIAELSELDYLPGLWANFKLKLRALTTTDKEKMGEILTIQELTQQLESVESDIRQLEKLLAECQNKSEQGAKITHHIKQRQGLSGDLEIPAAMIAMQQKANRGTDPHAHTKLGMEAMELGFEAVIKNLVAAHHVCTQDLNQLTIAADAKINALVGITPDPSAEK